MKILNIKMATPTNGGIITTADKYTEEESTHNGILDTTKLGVVKDLQAIVSVSDMVAARGYKQGDLVLLDFKRYAVQKQKKNNLKQSMHEHYDNTISFEIPTILLDNREHLLIDLNDISLKVNEFEWITEGEGLVTGEQIILN